jgi:hypothetical protein
MVCAFSNTASAQWFEIRNQAAAVIPTTLERTKELRRITHVRCLTAIRCSNLLSVTAAANNDASILIR